MSVYSLQETIFRNARRVGLTEIGEVDMELLEHEEWVRTLCEENACHNYGTSWACPPAVGTLQECRDLCAEYEHMLLFDRVYKLKDSYDLEGMDEAMRQFRKTVDRFDEIVGSLPRRHLFLANGGCTTCARCTWPDAPCRFPGRLHPSIEGFGLNIMKLADRSGLSYNHGYRTITLFGALLYTE